MGLGPGLYKRGKSEVDMNMYELILFALEYRCDMTSCFKFLPWLPHNERL